MRSMRDNQFDGEFDFNFIYGSSALLSHSSLFPTISHYEPPQGRHRPRSEAEQGAISG